MFVILAKFYFMERKSFRNTNKFLLLLALLLVMVSESWATHLRAGEITVKKVGTSGRTFDITITVYIDSESTVQFGGDPKDQLDVLDLGDGTLVFIPAQTTIPRPDLGVNVGIASYTYRHTYRGGSRFLISYREPNRNANVLNMTNSVETKFYLETELNIDAFLSNRNTPELKIPPVDRGCIGVAFQHNPGAVDIDGDSISYRLAIPFRESAQPVSGYVDPNNPRFYNSFGSGNEAGNGPPTFSIDEKTGTITWDSPGKQGEYNIAFEVIEWREIQGEWVKLGYVRRDMQIIIEDCDNERPDLILPDDVCIVAGETLTAEIQGFDRPNSGGQIDQIKIEVFGEIMEVGAFVPNPATVTNENVFQNGQNDADPEMIFTWNTECINVKQQSYQVVFKITDNGRPNLVTFKTWNITVIGPKPELQPVATNLLNRWAILNWTNYATDCNNASEIQVWRRVDSFAYTPDDCETGMPESLGYSLIATLPHTSTTYTDKNGGRGLAEGATYCYRLVALFPEPRGGESQISIEQCTTPFEAVAPVITKVSIEKTDETAGEVRVGWVAPLNPNPAFPVKEYRVLRSTNPSNMSSWIVAHTGALPDTQLELVDNNLNTKDLIYYYAIVVDARTTVSDPVGFRDTSSIASTVRLEIQSGTQRLTATWNADVPWSNVSESFPLHDVYRGPEGSTELAGLQLIAQVNTPIDGLTYDDVGQHNNAPLQESDVYCYRVMTRGTYGNPALPEPLENYSQILCAQPNDSNPPTCSPVVSIENLKNCEEYILNENNCGADAFDITVTWNINDQCGDDVIGYRVYAANAADQVFTLVDNLPNVLGNGLRYTRDTFYIDAGLTSLARCYKISAIDRSGNESPLSNAVCSDNCPYYELPNVFTPNNDGCNDTFSAFRNTSTGEELPDGACGPSPLDRYRCARFVEKVTFKVYNRWGNPVYEFESSLSENSEKSIYIDWNGKDDNNNLLPAGVYFYQADVVFDSSDPAKRTRTIKSWVHLVR